MTRTYAIADLHGRFDLLCRAIDLIEADAGDAGGKFVVLGDFVDRGPQSRNIIDLLMAGPQRPNWDWVVLQGNHEAMMLEALSTPSPQLMRWWVGNGGGQTLESYGYRSGDDLLPLRVPVEHMEWLRALPIYHEDGWRIFVHAGVPFDQPLTEAKPETLQWMLYPGDVDHDDAEFHPDEQHCSGKHIVHGHHQSASHPLLKRHRTNLDSFAWNTGRLAVAVFEDYYPAPARIMDALGPSAAR
ncbi:metallophosphoesterase family protein [Pelagerythrobacter aerophilus]|uniref:Serine/threonine protein phosphatase n=1 Tax=Pelagerythrobacter aerophilus TaxID=2306995 RepID=A0A418NK09_9SPHN|nr:metallophosphoesterase family protein [Pelagerythrobacter aerophilus]RIV79564.1 serine/threonine protein phosphatase [Pelagerythrobacter aerophilus]